MFRKIFNNNKFTPKQDIIWKTNMQEQGKIYEIMETICCQHMHKQVVIHQHHKFRSINQYNSYQLIQNHNKFSINVLHNETDTNP